MGERWGSSAVEGRDKSGVDPRGRSTVELRIPVNGGVKEPEFLEEGGAAKDVRNLEVEEFLQLIGLEVPRAADS